MKLFHGKWLCVLLAVLLMLGSVPVLADTPAPVLGDVDDSGIIDAGDALMVLQHSVRLISLDQVQMEAADVTGDGQIDAEDALCILQYLVQLRDSFPASPVPEEIEINSTNFPDDVFREDVRGFDLDGNGWLSDAEIEQVTEIEVSVPEVVADVYPYPPTREKIRDLTGIQYFTSLEILECNNNLLKEIDLVHNTDLTHLSCSTNELTSLNVGANTQLQSLECYSNQLTELDLTNNTALTKLVCMNNNLTSLDVSCNINLQLLYCNNNNLSELNLENNIALKELWCRKNNLTELDLTNNALLKTLDCDDTVIVTRWSPTLDSQTEQQMLEDFVSYLNETHSLACGVDEVGIETYFGTYNGCVVAYMRSPASYDDALTDLVVGSYTFVLPGLGPVPLIVAYKEGTFMGLREAFEAGWLTEEAVGDVWQKYSNG